MNGSVSSIVPFGGAVPTAEQLDVWTTFSAPARSASSITIRVPPTLTAKTRSRSLTRIEVVPATWKTFDTSSIARRTEARSVTSPSARSQSRSSMWEVSRPSRTRRRRSSPRAASCLTRCEPMKPVPPVTSVLAMAGW